MTEKEFKENIKGFYDVVLDSYDIVLEYSKGNSLTRERVQKLYDMKLDSQRRGRTTPLISYIHIKTNHKLYSPAFVYSSMLRVMDFFRADKFDKNLMLEVVDCKESLYNLFFYNAILQEIKDVQNGKYTMKELSEFNKEM